MDIFFLTLRQMLTMMFLIALGYILRRAKIVPDNAGSTMAKLETYIFVPALSISNQMEYCTPESFIENSPLILYGFAIVMVSVLLSYPLSKLFVRNDKDSPENAYQRNIYKYALTFGNYGFMGYFIVQGVWGNEALFKYYLFVLLVGIMCTGWGLYILIPKDQNAGALKNLKKGLLTPPIIALVLGIVLGLVGAKEYVPEFMKSALEKAGNCQGPVAMVLAGVIIGGYDFKKLWTNGKVYIATFMRLVIIPSVIMLVLKAVGASKEIMTFALIAFATPLGMNTIVYPATYGGDTKTGASMTMVSHILSVITIPLMYLLFIEIL